MEGLKVAWRDRVRIQEKEFKIAKSPDPTRSRPCPSLSCANWSCILVSWAWMQPQVPPKMMRPSIHSVHLDIDVEGISHPQTNG